MKKFIGNNEYFISQNNFISKMIEEGAVINLHWLNFFINMNTVEDYTKVKKIFAKNPQFMLQ